MKLVLSVASGVLIVAVLVITSNRPNIKLNGFERIFLEGSPVMLGRLSFAAEDLRSIAGVAENSVYFSTASPDRFIRTHLGSFESEQLRFSPDAAFMARTGQNFSSYLIDSTIYIFSGPAVAIAAIDIISGKSTHTRLNIPGFIYGVPISKISYYLRAFLPNRRDIAFARVTVQPDTIKYLLEMPGDSILKDPLKSDGALRYSQTGHVTYVFYYQSRIVTFDENSGTIKVFNTIENTAGLPRRRSGAAPLTIHQTACVFGERLYVCSNLRADNEAREAYFKNVPVDVYNAGTGRYIGSFYLPLSGRSLVKSMFMDREGKLLVLYQDKNFVMYSVPALTDL